MTRNLRQEISLWTPRTDAEWAMAISRARSATFASAVAFWGGLLLCALSVYSALHSPGEHHAATSTVQFFISISVAFVGAVTYLLTTAGGWGNPKGKVGMVEAESDTMEKVADELQQHDATSDDELDGLVMCAAERIPTSGPLYKADMIDLLTALRARRAERLARDERLRVLGTAHGLTAGKRDAASRTA